MQAYGCARDNMCPILQARLIFIPARQHGTRDYGWRTLDWCICRELKCVGRARHKIERVEFGESVKILELLQPLDMPRGFEGGNANFVVF